MTKMTMSTGEKKVTFFMFCMAFFCVGGLCGSYWTKYLYEQKQTLPPIADQIRAVSGISNASTLYRYKVEKVLRVVDGDTYDFRFFSWSDNLKIRRVRLLKVDTPELRPRKGTDAEKAAEKVAAAAARDFVQQLMDKYAGEMYIITDWKADGFGRLLAGVLYKDASGKVQNLAAVLLEAGHAKLYRK